MSKNPGIFVVDLQALQLGDKELAALDADLKKLVEQRLAKLPSLTQPKLEPIGAASFDPEVDDICPPWPFPWSDPQPNPWRGLKLSKIDQVAIKRPWEWMGYRIREATSPVAVLAHSEQGLLDRVKALEARVAKLQR